MPQYSCLQVFAVWALAVGPMAAIAWWWVPLWLPEDPSPVDWGKGLIVGFGCGLVWQCVLTLALVWHERGDLRAGTLKDALWLHPPRHPGTGKHGGAVWWVCLPLAIAMALQGLVPSFDPPTHRDLSALMQSTHWQAFMHGNWSWFALFLMMLFFNTVAGEELLFRGLLLPRMKAAFGRGDWSTNGVLFALYHLHQPWSMHAVLLDLFVLSWPTKYFQSAWIGIVVHSAQSLVLAALMLALLL
jgi:uncharacterized protein